MPQEVELKFEVPPAMLRLLNDRLQRLADEPAQHGKLVSVYFDTANGALRAKGLTLRVGHAAGRYLQTVKGSGIHRRQEWEKEIAAGRPDRDAARETAIKSFTAKKTWRKLRPVFETDIGRTSIPLSFGKSRIEAALDRGAVRAGRRSQPVSEVELELKEGELADLARLAQTITRGTTATFGLRSKAARGYALADGKAADPVAAAPILLDPAATAAQGFRVIALSCLQHLDANRAAVLKGDPEGVHQMRVGLRRLRAALSLFKPMLEGAQFERVKRDLKWITGELGPARDFDVFVEDTIAAMKKDAPAGLAALESDLKQKRAQGFSRAKRMAVSERYRRILLSTGLWLTSGDWATGSDAMRRDLRERKLCDAVRDILEQRSAKVAGKLKKLDRLDAKGRHKLRIAVKKLRYATGFFESLYPKNRDRKRFAVRLKALQSALGRLNDMQVHRDFARHVVKGKGPLPRGAYALGVVRGVERKTLRPCLAAAAKAGKRLQKLKAFWR